MRQLAALMFATVMCMPAAAAAQARIDSDIPLSRVIYELYNTEIDSNIEVLRLLGLLTPGLESALLADKDEALVITQAIGLQLSSFPLGSSAGGFSWTFDPSIGTRTRTTTSFGPVFAERALTVGRNQLNFGFNYQRATYDEFEGQNLRDGEIAFFTPFLANFIGEDALSLNLSVDTAGLFVNYGITNRLDVGVAVPIVSVNMDGRLTFLFRNQSGAEVPTSGFPSTLSGGGRKTGIGDVVVRSKYNIMPWQGGGVAAGVDLRLPTGDEDNLLGIPGTQAKVFGIVSAAFSKVSPHVNIGYTFSRGNDKAKDPASIFLIPPDELNYTGGIDVAITPKLTVAGDFVGRTTRDVPRLTLGEGIGAAFAEFDFDGRRDLHQALISAGAKYNVWRNLLVSGNVLFPANSAGLRDRLTTVFGLDFSY